MIKLNNKNITYVALADSANSIKAPKEVWYADSNNSVKLVYRRKDALIEGEDYEKYHWLEGDGTAHIDIPVNIYRDTVNTLLIPKVDYSVIAYQGMKDIGNNNVAEFRTMIGGTQEFSIRHGVRINDTPTTIIRGFSNNYIDKIFEISTYRNGSNYCGTINGTTYRIANGDIQSADTNITMAIILKKFKLGYFRIPTKFSLIPCRLLRPVPKWLDANGIRRQVGECGMIDLVSGKFYGNVNNVGTFTVENYYERKEWLQGRNGAYIDTNYYPIVGTDIFSVHFHYDGTLRNPDGTEQDVFGVETNNNCRLSAYINSDNYLACNYFKKSNSYWPSTAKHSEDWVVSELMSVESNFQYTANGIVYSFTNQSMPSFTSQLSIYLFNKNQTNTYNNYFHGDIASFKITDTSSNTKMNLIPCTLTMDLPASMDANNIARTKGTSGMWDLVSDRFYGNVANSGTFKAVNLAEGVDYEVHQWLKGDGEAYIDTNKLLVETDIIITKFVLIDKPSNYYLIYGNNSGTFTTTACVQFSNKLGISPIATDSRCEVNYQLSSEITISHSATEILVNGTSVWQGTSVFVTQTTKCCLFATGTGTNHCFNGKVGYFNISDNLNLIPVKLLRSIPSKYDANGIARNAGECGMYDTVNDVFYGNVASSGSFTVEDDS